MKLQEYGYFVHAVYSLPETGARRHYYRCEHSKTFVPSLAWVLEKMQLNGISTQFIQGLRIYAFAHDSYIKTIL